MIVVLLIDILIFFFLDGIRGIFLMFLVGSGFLLLNSGYGILLWDLLGDNFIDFMSVMSFVFIVCVFGDFVSFVVGEFNRKSCVWNFLWF